MKIAVMSDVHSRIETLQGAIHCAKKRGVEKIYCLGDIVGYNLHPNECIDLISENNIESVMGNHDRAATDKTYLESMDFNEDAYETIEWTREMLKEKQMNFIKTLPYKIETNEFICVHGELTNPEVFNYLFFDNSRIKTLREMMQNARLEVNLNMLKNNQILFVGHTHMPQVIVENGRGPQEINIEKIDISHYEKVICNVGSISIPRNGKLPCFVIYDTEKRKVEYVTVSLMN